MKGKGETGRTSIYKRITALYLALILLFCLFAGGATAYISEEIRARLRESARHQAQSSLMRLEQEIRRISDSLSLLLEDSKVQDIAYLYDLYTDYQRVERLNNIRDMLIYAKRTSDVVMNVKLMLPTRGRAVHSTGSYTVIPYDEAEYQRLREISALKVPLHLDQGRIMISISAGATKNAVNASVELSPSALISLLSGMQENSGCAFALTGEEGALLSSLDAFQSARLARLEVGETAFFRAGGSTCQMDYRYSDYLSCGFVYARYTDEVESRVRALVGVSGMLVAVMLAFFAGSIVYMRRLINHPLKQLVTAFGKVERGSFPQLRREKENEFDFLINAFNRMSNELDQTINEVYRQKLLLREADIRQLQAQINPHFLYNSFFMLHQTIRTHSDDKALMISKMLGQYFKYIARNDQPMVALEMEYEHARIYASVQALRFEDRVSVEFPPLRETMKDIRVPKLILQPLIENAFKYGLECLEEGGKLRITTDLAQGGELTIRVEDNGTALSDSDMEALRARVYAYGAPDAETTGLSNIHARIRLTYGEGCGLIIARSPLGGLSVSVRLTAGAEFRGACAASEERGKQSEGISAFST